MFSKLSLRTKLSVLVGVSIALAVGLCLSLFLVNAASRVRSESDSAFKLAHDFVQSAIIGIQDSKDPGEALQRVVEEANSSRHIRIYSEKFTSTDRELREVTPPPAWFSRLLAATSQRDEIEIAISGQRFDKITIETSSLDEISEIWQEIKWIALASLIIIFIISIMIVWVVSKTLSPINDYVAALNRLDSGERNINISNNRTPEFQIISDRINTLAKTLHALDDENHILIQKMIKVQDDERKDLARDLHDEYGPALFMARVGIGEVRKKVDKISQSSSFHEEWAIVDGTLDKLQQINRRILGRLRPAALEEVGLSGAVEAMVQSWREAHPNIALSCALSQDHFVLDEHRALTAYRIIQEALTNIYRHAHATQASVQIEEDKVEYKSCLKIIITDNGKGIASDVSQGVGLRGMRERIFSVDGELKINNAGPGTRIEATIPLIKV